MKKLFTFFISLFCFTHGFAQTYEELFKKAQEYENNKQWIHAIVSYYNALEIEHSEDAQIALNKLIETIKNDEGFDEFDLYERQENIHKEIYSCLFIENFPFYVKISKPERISINIKDKTASYRFNVNFAFSDAFNFLKDNGIVRYSLKDYLENLPMHKTKLYIQSSRSYIEQEFWAYQEPCFSIDLKIKDLKTEKVLASKKFCYKYYEEDSFVLENIPRESMSSIENLDIKIEAENAKIYYDYITTTPPSPYGGSYTNNLTNAKYISYKGPIKIILGEDDSNSY